MDLEWSPEQEMLRDTARGVCAKYAPLDVVRAMEDDPVGFPSDFWKQLGELGLIGILIPEAYGGAGLGALEAAILYEELGRSLAPSPHFPSARHAVRRTCQSDAARRVVSGTVALLAAFP